MHALYAPCIHQFTPSPTRPFPYFPYSPISLFLFHYHCEKIKFRRKVGSYVFFIILDSLIIVINQSNICDMKKVISLFAVIVMLAAANRTFAQCTPNPTQNQFLMPDTLVNFDTAWTLKPYSQVLYIAVPTDTTILGQPVSVDSIVLTGITGLPTGFTFTSNPANGIYHPGSKACIQFSGTAPASAIGLHKLVINANVSFYSTTFGHLTYPIPWNGYKIWVFDSASIGIQKAEPWYAFSVDQNIPNPFSDKTEITYNSRGNETISLQVFDMLGNKVFEKISVSARGSNSVYLGAAGFEPGMYFYRVSNGNSTYTRRMIITD